MESGYKRLESGYKRLESGYERPESGYERLESGDTYGRTRPLCHLFLPNFDRIQ